VIKGVSHLLLQVRELQRSEEFYLNLLEFSIRERTILKDGRPLTALNEGLGLTVFPENANAGFPTADHIAFRVDELKTFVDRLTKAHISYEAVSSPRYGNSIYFFDPDGNRIELHDQLNIT
jgi:catechol 2,3-dioxygenase-like lactoylglutathione lyase family enzyme